MAFQAAGWVGAPSLRIPSSDYYVPRKRRPVYLTGDGLEKNNDFPPSKRQRYFETDVHFRYEPTFSLERRAYPEFLVLWEDQYDSIPNQTPEPDSAEDAAPGLAISADAVGQCASAELLDDAVAAQRVHDHMAAFRRRFPDSKHERILRNIIRPRPCATASAEYDIDNDALQSIFSAANEIFFNGRLSQRVTWDWPHSYGPQHDSGVIGTTALRSAGRRRGYETLIVLSSPVLRDKKYSRRLLISTFLHELIHSYLFICRGFGAKQCGGHTPGFHKIAKLIDDWAGPNSFLYLCNIEADLNCFRVGGDGHGEEGRDCMNDFGSADRNSYVSRPYSGVVESPQARYHHHEHGEGDARYEREWRPTSDSPIPYWQR